MLKHLGPLDRLVDRGLKSIGKQFGYPRLTRIEFQALSSAELKHENGPICYFEIGKNDLRRTLYTFFKFFDLAGCNVVVKPNNMLFAEMKSDLYGRWVIEEQLIKIGQKPINVDGKFSFKRHKDMTLISDDYFRSDPDSYFFPITQHPDMYSQGYWNEDVATPSNERIQSVFFAGNFNPTTYQRIKRDGLFDVIIRTDLINSIKAKHRYHYISGLHDLGNFKFEGQVVIADIDLFEVPRKILRKTLGMYSFFLAAPGASVPLSHNLAEAMSVGAIPIIENTYAELMHPHLKDGENALVFTGLDGLSECIDNAHGMNKDDISILSQNVFDYYNTFMTPEVVVQNLMRSDVKRINVISFSSSIKYLK